MINYASFFQINSILKILIRYCYFKIYTRTNQSTSRLWFYVRRTRVVFIINIEARQVIGSEYRQFFPHVLTDSKQRVSNLSIRRLVEQSVVITVATFVSAAVICL